MNDIETMWIARLGAAVKDPVRHHLQSLPLQELAAIDRVEALCQKLVHGIAQAVFEVWAHVLTEEAITVAKTCPSCGRARKVKTRAPMQVHVLGMTVALPKPYLHCDCGTKGVSITPVLTGLSSGKKSGALQLMAAYCGAEHSYGKSSRDLEVHHGESVERTAVRRMALDVECHAIAFAEQERRETLKRVGQEQNQHGPERLMFQGDGGVVRTGTLQPCERGDPGYGKKTQKTGRPRRKRDTQFREIITLDVREPGETVASALDVVVPVVAPEGERARRMLALASRKGLGDNTKVFGLGDMGSSLADSFDEAFVGYEAKYSADWKHTSDYVRHAAAVFVGLDAKRWSKAMKDALWNRVRRKADALIERAREHRVAQLPTHMEKCPIHALSTYVNNNWERLHAKSFKEQGLDYVSGRAEAQVRERTKPRFRVPGAWRHENLEGKAVLRAIIADGRWSRFREHYLKTLRDSSRIRFKQRLEQAVSEGRIRPLDTGNRTHHQEQSRQAA